MSKKKCIDFTKIPIGKRVLYAPDDPHFRGVYVYKSKRGVLTWSLFTRVDGKNQWIKVGTHIDGFGPEHVVAKRQEIEVAKSKGDVESVVPSRQVSCTLNQAWDAWVNWKESEGLSKNYIQIEMSRYDSHVRNNIGSRTLEELCAKPNLINDLQGTMRDNGYKENSIKQVMMNIKKAFKQAQSEGLYKGPIPFRNKHDANTNGVLIRNSRAKRERWLTREQAKEFMEYLHTLARQADNRYAPGGLKAYRQAAFALYTGLRQGEVLRLTTNAIDLDTMQIYVNKVKHANMADKSRYVDIPQVLVPIIQDLLQEKAWRPNERFFKTFAQKIFIKAFNHFGFNDGVEGKDIANRISFHSLRHTFGALHVEAGTHLVTIKEMMGHDTIEAVQIYAKAGPNVRKVATASYNQFWA